MYLSGLSASLRSKGSLVPFPVRAHAWVAGQVPSRGCMRGNHTLMFLSLSFSLPFSLSKKINKYNLKKINYFCHVYNFLKIWCSWEHGYHKTSSRLQCSTTNWQASFLRLCIFQPPLPFFSSWGPTPWPGSVHCCLLRYWTIQSVDTWRMRQMGWWGKKGSRREEMLEGRNCCRATVSSGALQGWLHGIGHRSPVNLPAFVCSFL